MSSLMHHGEKGQRWGVRRYQNKDGTKFNSSRGELTDVVQHTSIGGTMYIEGNALILGDSSYLEHHGIRGQRWGVRRFQNRDGSLTNAGRKRLGYATKGVTQTVGKAFKAGVKAGGNAVKAVKAHHEKKEAEKLQKKKEKASKTRLGVMANKDLFTNEEIRKLNERFKLEDEMKMATLQKGVEIAKAVGIIAQNVGTTAKAYEDVTGQSLSPIKRKAAEEKVKQDAEDRKRKLAKEDAETKRAEDKEKRDIEDRERRIKFEDEDRVRKQAKEDADAQRAENAEKRAQAKEQRASSMAVELQRKAKAAADEQEHKAVKAKAESRSAILDVLEKIDKIQDHDDDDNNPPGGGIDDWNDDDYLNFFKKTGIIHSGIIDSDLIQNGVLFVGSSDGLAHHDVRGQQRSVKEDSMTHYVENGTLFINAGEPYLEHHGVKGMKWGKHLMAGKSEAGAGGGAGEDDEKLKEMAKKAGMSVAEYRNKFAKEISRMNTDSAERKEGSHWALAKAGSALRGAKAALKEGPSGVTDRIYDAAGGKYKKQAVSNTKAAREDVQKEKLANRMANQQRAREASEVRKKGGRASRDKGFNTVNGHDVIAEGYRNARQKHQKAASEANAKYEKSLAGKYDKMKAGRAKQVKDLSAKASAAKKRLKDIPGELYGSKHRKDFERNARLLEGSTRSAVELGRDTYKRHGPTSGFGDPTYKATDDAYKRANKQWNKARVSGQKYDRSIAKRVDSLARKASKVRKTIEQKKLFSGTSPKAKKAVIVKKKVTPTSYEKQISNARDDVEKAARSNEAAYRHAKEVYRQTGGDSDAYKQAIKRSRTTLQRSLESQKRLKQKKRAKHSDDTNAVYTEGTRLVIHPKA